MNFIFYKKITLKSKFNVTELLEILKSNSNPEMIFSNDSKPFKGFIFKDNSLWLKRNSLSRNTFSSTIKGKIAATDQTSELEISFIMNIAGWIVLGLINMIIFIIVITSVTYSNISFSDFSPLFFSLFSYIFALTGFNYDLKKSLNELNKLIS